MILFRSSLAASAWGSFIWEQLSILHQSLATITRGLVNILPGSLAEAGSWELSCVMRTQVQSVTMLQWCYKVTKCSARHGNRNTQGITRAMTLLAYFLTGRGWITINYLVLHVTSLSCDINCDGECDA